MAFQVLASIVYGLWFIAAPQSYALLMGASAGDINELANGNLTIVGVGLLVAANVFNLLRKLVTPDHCATFMPTFACGWLAYGIGQLYVSARADMLSLDNMNVLQGMLFIAFAAVYYLKRTPDQHTQPAQQADHFNQGGPL